jgi:hypothetical protein
MGVQGSRSRGKGGRTRREGETMDHFARRGQGGQDRAGRDSTTRTRMVSRRLGANRSLSRPTAQIPRVLEQEAFGQPQEVRSLPSPCSLEDPLQGYPWNGSPQGASPSWSRDGRSGARDPTEELTFLRMVDRPWSRCLGAPQAL